MPKSEQLNHTFNFVLRRLMDTGRAPSYKEIADELTLAPQAGLKTLRKLFRTLGFPGWFHPKTEDIASFAPFSTAVNNHRITIDGKQKWFGQ